MWCMKGMRGVCTRFMHKKIYSYPHPPQVSNQPADRADWRILIYIRSNHGNMYIPRRTILCMQCGCARSILQARISASKKKWCRTMSSSDRLHTRCHVPLHRSLHTVSKWEHFQPLSINGHRCMVAVTTTKLKNCENVHDTMGQKHRYLNNDSGKTFGWNQVQHIYTVVDRVAS